MKFCNSCEVVDALVKGGFIDKKKMFEARDYLVWAITEKVNTQSEHGTVSLKQFPSLAKEVIEI